MSISTPNLSKRYPPTSPYTPLSPPPLPPTSPSTSFRLNLILSSLPPLDPSTLITTYTLLKLYLTLSSKSITPPSDIDFVLKTLKLVIELLIKRNMIIQEHQITLTSTYSSGFERKQNSLREQLQRVNVLLNHVRPVVETVETRVIELPSQSELILAASELEYIALNDFPTEQVFYTNNLGTVELTDEGVRIGNVGVLEYAFLEDVGCTFDSGFSVAVGSFLFDFG